MKVKKKKWNVLLGFSCVLLILVLVVFVSNNCRSVQFESLGQKHCSENKLIIPCGKSTVKPIPEKFPGFHWTYQPGEKSVSFYISLFRVPLGLLFLRRFFIPGLTVCSV